MKLLLDINIVLDVLLQGSPHFKASQELWAAIETGEAEGFLSAHAVTTIHYLVRQQLNAQKTMQIVAALLEVFEVAPVDAKVIDQARKLAMSDFEDAVSAAAARGAGCDFIITRDPRGFRGSPVRSITPEAAVGALGTS